MLYVKVLIEIIKQTNNINSLIYLYIQNSLDDIYFFRKHLDAKKTRN